MLIIGGTVVLVVWCVVPGVPFPKSFLASCKTILKRLFRVYAHIYHQHFREVVSLGEEAHLNTSFKHFIFFVQEFNLIDKRELQPLAELIEKLASKDRWTPSVWLSRSVQFNFSSHYLC